jgi:hypothetical protein
VISLQSVSTHQKDLFTVRIKKGTLIVVDINTKDYQGRMALPHHFVSENRIKMMPLITDTTDRTIIDSELEVLAKYIQLYWDEPKLKILNGQRGLTPEQQEEWERQQNKYYTYAQVF